MCVLYSRHLDRGDGCILSISIRHESFWISGRVGVSDALERSLWRVLVLWKLPRSNFGRFHFYPVCVGRHTLQYHPFKAQVAQDSRWAIGQHWRSTLAKRTKCVKDGHCYFVRVCNLLVAPYYQIFTLLLFTGYQDILWIPIFCSCCFFHGQHKLCCQPLHLFHFQ